MEVQRQFDILFANLPGSGELTEDVVPFKNPSSSEAWKGEICHYRNQNGRINQDMALM